MNLAFINDSKSSDPYIELKLTKKNDLNSETETDQNKKAFDVSAFENATLKTKFVLKKGLPANRKREIKEILKKLTLSIDIIDSLKSKSLNSADNSDQDESLTFIKVIAQSKIDPILGSQNSDTNQNDHAALHDLHDLLGRNDGEIVGISIEIKN